MNFQNAVAVVTGAASGIGRELAIQLAQQGSNLVITDVNEAELAETANMLDSYDVKVKPLALDVSDASAFRVMADEVEAEFGPANMIFNNAGIAIDGKVGTVDRGMFERVMAVNFWGVVNGTEAFLPQLKRASWGAVINVSSLFGFLGIPGQSSYCASKFAVRGYTESLAHELRHSDVNAICVHPGGIQTNIVANATKHLSDAERNKEIEKFKKMAPTTAQQAAAIILAGVKKGHRRVVVGKDAKFLSRIANWMPNSYEKVLAKMFNWR